MPRTTSSRRHFLQHAATLGILSVLPSPILAQIITRQPPMSPFGSSSTAEEVTEGLDLSGMNIAITGCNSGLGYETMRVLALRGAHVIGIARTQAKAEKACAGVEGQTKVSSSTIWMAAASTTPGMPAASPNWLTPSARGSWPRKSLTPTQPPTAYIRV